MCVTNVMKVLLLSVGPIAGGHQAALGSVRQVFDKLLLRQVVGLALVVHAPHPLSTCNVACNTRLYTFQSMSGGRSTIGHQVLYIAAQPNLAP